MSDQKIPPMSVSEAVKILRAHNAWRRCWRSPEETKHPEQQNPLKVGRAIDVLCAHAEANP